VTLLGAPFEDVFAFATFCGGGSAVGVLGKYSVEVDMMEVESEEQVEHWRVFIELMR